MLRCLPFMLEEKRVPKAGPNQLLQVSLETAPLFELYLKRIAREGFFPEELKLQVMVEPRRGGPTAIELLESSLKVER